MTAAQSTSPHPVAPEGPSRAVRAKIRLRFRKEGHLRLVSHHDLMHCFERMFRRAEIAVAHTQGFHPTPRMVFALSLALGIVGCEEVVELELTEELSAAEVLRRLQEQSPPGLNITSANAIVGKSSAQARRVCYQVTVPPERLDGLTERLASFLNATECWIERTRPQPRRLNLRPFVRGLAVLEQPNLLARLAGSPAALAAGWRNPAAYAAGSPAQGEPESPSPIGEGLGRGSALGSTLEMDLWVAPSGVARPEEVLGLLGLQDLLDAGALLYRTRVELHDEPHDSDPLPAILTGPGQRARSAAPVAAPPTALLPGPLSFDS